MDKKILMAVDDSSSSRHAVRYAIRIWPLIGKPDFTLFHVQPQISGFLEDEAKTDLRAKYSVERLKKKQTEHSKNMLEKYKKDMIDAGLDEDSIDIVTRSKKVGLAKDVIEYAQEGLYDSILSGRRGVVGIQKVFMPSMTSNLLEHSQLIPVWVVDGKIDSSRFIMAVDGSESSLRAVDHFAFMIGDNPDIHLTIFHVSPRLKDFCSIEFGEKDDELKDVVIRGSKKCVDHFYVHALKMLKETGITEDQIEIKEIKCPMNVGKALVEEINQGDYGTVVVGRRGMNKAFFMGSVSKYVLDNASDRALWLVP